MTLEPQLTPRGKPIISLLNNKKGYRQFEGFNYKRKVSFSLQEDGSSQKQQDNDSELVTPVEFGDMDSQDKFNSFSN